MVSKHIIHNSIWHHIVTEGWSISLITDSEVMWPYRNAHFMMTASNRNVFCVTGALRGGSSGYRWIPPQRSVARNFAVFFDLRLNKWLSKQSRRWWFSAPSRSLCRHDYIIHYTTSATWHIWHTYTMSDSGQLAWEVIWKSCYVFTISADSLILNKT